MGRMQLDSAVVKKVLEADYSILVTKVGGKAQLNGVQRFWDLSTL